jgi:hypothetical protein
MQGDADVVLDNVNRRIIDTHDEFIRARQKGLITEAQLEPYLNFGKRWNDFYTVQITRTFMIFDVKEVMDTADAFDKERYDFRKWLTSIAPEATPGPDSTAAGSKNEVNPPWNISINLVLGVVGLGIVAYMVGPAVRTWASSLANKSAAKANPAGPGPFPRGKSLNEQMAYMRLRDAETKQARSSEPLAEAAWMLSKGRDVHGISVRRLIDGGFAKYGKPYRRTIEDGSVVTITPIVITASGKTLAKMWRTD